MRGIPIAFCVLLLGSAAQAQIPSNLPVPEGVHTTMPWMEPWEVPKDHKPDDPVKPPCTCDDLKKRLDQVERLRSAYTKAYRDESFCYDATLTRFIEKEMGWDEGSAAPQGKPADETTTEQERKEAAEKCKNCAWICKVSIQTVHEGYHKWFNRQYLGQAYNLVTLWDLAHLNQCTFVSYKELGEVGSYQAEATFLRQTLQEMERRGLCQGVAGTPSPEEMEAGWKQAEAEARFILGLSPTVSPL
jgi:hypothetical protein